MYTFLLITLLITIILMVILILLQQGKGAEMGASFGSGGADTVFGAAGSISFFAKITTLLSVIFFVTSLTLAIVSKQQVTVTTDAFDLGVDSKAADQQTPTTPAPQDEDLELPFEDQP